MFESALILFSLYNSQTGRFAVGTTQGFPAENYGNAL